MSTKRAAQVGDVFSIRTTVTEGLFGRVISTSAIVGPIHGCSLVYVYRPGSEGGRSDLLVPPLMTSRFPWSSGYFQVVRSEPLLPGLYFERHCFRDARGFFYDEESRPVSAPFEPVGVWHLYEELPALEQAWAEALRPS